MKQKTIDCLNLMGKPFPQRKQLFENLEAMYSSKVVIRKLQELARRELIVMAPDILASSLTPKGMEILNNAQMLNK
jgi:hypothetical protein